MMDCMLFVCLGVLIIIIIIIIIIIVCVFYCFINFFVWKRILTQKKQISLVNLHLTLFSRWWIFTQLFLKRGELMVNPDLTILLRRWTEVKTWGG